MPNRSRSSLLALLVTAACAKSEPPAPPPAAATPQPPATVTVTATNYAFAMPDTIAAGPTMFHLIENGTEIHHLAIVKLGEGHTAADLAALKPTDPPPAWATSMGGPNAARPGGGESWGMVDLAPGNYVAMCFIPTPAPENMPHFLKGMVHPFVVAPSTATFAIPESDVTLTLSDYGFSLSTPLTAGTHNIKVVNNAAQDHEVLFVRLAPGKTAKDMLTWFEAGTKGPPPGEPIGGATGIAPGGTNIIREDLTPGEYALYCFLMAPDGKMHYQHGMVQQFTVN